MKSIAGFMCASILTGTLFSCAADTSSGGGSGSAALPDNDEKYEYATFAGGCFWCMEPPFENLDGVIRVVSGYTGGEKPNPSYNEVASGQTKHAESVRITYDPNKITYEKLLNVFWRNIDPTDSGGQFADRGSQYRTAIFYHNDTQKTLAEKSKQAIAQSGRFNEAIVTSIEEANTFYKAESYHQDYYKKNPTHYNRYKVGSGRAGYIERTWGDEKK